jgi:sugar lactone lactonase YvrE
VFKFAPDGRFVTRFGGRGNQPGQFRAPQSITVDNQGRVYVGDGGGVQVFDPDGRYLDAFKVEGVAFGMDFNDQNELFIAARTQVLKFVIKKP